MKTTRCTACGKRWRLDEGGLEEPACKCQCCARCVKWFIEGDEEGPSIASTDELAAKHDSLDQGMCQACWVEVEVEVEKEMDS